MEYFSQKLDLINTYDVIYIIVFFGLYTFAITVMIILFQRKKHRKEIEKKYLELALEKEKSTKELIALKKETQTKIANETRKKLRVMANNLNEKNRLIQKLQEANFRENESIIQALSSSFILTEEQWKKFSVDYRKAFPGYLERIKVIFPDITPAELRLICLANLDCSYREIANLQGISIETVRSTWYRFRKKYDKISDKSLEALAKEI